ncbi:MAG: hypothetical protein KIT84_38955 [Labilithrix sp.]|nr:hypothetical protein [Labilithrix sp.]MCW5817042.1 hypothetical protein [Labilithrix sp.]
MRRALALAALAISFAACVEAKVDPGVDATLQIRSAQFHRGVMPEESGGPDVLNATVPSIVAAGRHDYGVGGELDRAATGVAVGFAGDVGWWSLPAQTPSSSAPLAPTFAFAFGITAATTPGKRDLVVRAVDGEGRFGPAQVRAMEIAPRAVATGRFVVSLTWDSQVDLDLNVTLPNGVVIFKRNPAEFILPPPSAGVFDPLLPRDGGVLDRDSNARCVLDGVRTENVVWKEPPPPGRYAVRVDTFSLCGADRASWHVTAVLDGVTIGGASGIATENDLRFEHNRGAGVLALEVDVP